MKQRKYQHDYFNIWRDSFKPCYLWLQVNYLTDSLEPYHFISEINDARDNNILWPIQSFINSPLPITDLDFRNGNKYNFDNWHNELSKFSGREIVPTGAVLNPISTYEEYIRQARLNVSSCVDIDVIETSKRIVGIEGTHLYKNMYNKDEALRLFSFILEKRFFLDAAHQLAVQYKALKLLSSDLFLFIYNTRGDVLCEECNSLRIKVDSEFLTALGKRSKNECLERAIYAPFRENYSKIVEG